ncbi:MAG: MaoC/PaaZ C-terminal domain-containing protein [Chloroflexi bacterium]|nr:MaoC/PaaZ C-terminal domain-containing protein [Chloroflexota bacterium]
MFKMEADGPRGLYFEEFEIGRTMRTRGRTITEADLVQFAALTGDYNPMHTDAEYSKDSFMRARVAHGMLSLSYAIGQAYQLGILERTVLGFRGLDMKFSSPVYIGDTIHAELKVTEAKEARRLGGGLVTLDLRIVKQDGVIAQKGSMSLLMMSRP